MKKQLLPLAGALGLAWICALSARAQAPLTVEGVADRNFGAYSGKVTLRVPSAAGYSYRVVLDATNTLPTDVWTDVTAPQYHELAVWRTNLQSGATTNSLTRFILRDSGRSASQSTEDGLPPFTPWPPIPSGSNEFAGARLMLIAPEIFPAGYDIPVVAWVLDAEGHAVRANGALQSGLGAAIPVKRGVGAGFLPSTLPGGFVNYTPRIQGLATNKVILLENEPAWTSVGGALPASTAWGEESFIWITSTLTVPASGTLTIGAGAVVRINPGVDIYLDGKLVLNGTAQRPVVFMPNTHAQPWGGFWLRTATSQIQGTGAIFTGSGANPSWFGSNNRPGSHRTEQSLFYCTNRASITLADSAAFSLAGQLGHSVGADGTARHFFNYTRFLMQGVTSGGEYTDSIWTANDSAFIDAHLDSPPYWQFNDADEDALYLVNAPTPYVIGFTNTLFGWTRDDGIDSGGSGPGKFRYNHCWFESTYHEANSLSGVQSGSAHADKDVLHSDGVFFGTGQACENGYGAVTGRIDHCLMLAGAVGVRFGDNYNWTYYGFMSATNSILINNHRDVWGMTWQPDATGWYYRTNAMDVRSNFLSQPNPFHPANNLWNPAVDAPRLISFRGTPAEAAPGAGFAIWTNQFPLTNLFSGAPVGLSSFSTNFVRIDYAFLEGAITLSTGTLEFAPGEVVKRIYPAGFNLADKTSVQVVLTAAVNGELTGQTNVTYAGSVPAASISLRAGGSQMDIARAPEGLAVALSAPSSLRVSVDYTWQASGRAIASGTLVFEPGILQLWVPAPGPAAAGEDILRLSLGNPSGAPLGTPASYYLVRTVAAPAPSTTPYVATGKRWTYYDTVTAALANWYGTNYNDTAWLGGPSPLGYGNTPREATTVGFGPSSSSKYISTYFRTTFTATNTAAIASLTFSLLRDDGAIVYWNGVELYRDNVAAGATYSTVSVTNVSNTAVQYNSRTYLLSALPSPLREGTNWVAVEVHQSGGGSSDILMDLQVTGNPASASNPPQHVYLGAFGPQTTLAWTDTSYVLESAVIVTGPWTPAATNSPFTLNPTEPQRFFRLRK